MLQDLKYAFRSFFRQPSFALTAILTLALGIGATTAIFSVVNAVVLRPLPFEDADRIVAFNTVNLRTGLRSPNASAPDFHDWKAQSRSFEAMGYYAGGLDSVSINGVADYAFVMRVTPGTLEALGANTQIGRLLSAEEQQPGGPLAVVITDAFWRSTFGANPRVLGATIKYDEKLFTIVGVLQPGIRFPSRVDFYYPAWMQDETGRSGHNYRVIARLKPGVSVEQAQSEMSAVAARLADAYPESNRNKGIAVIPLQELIVGNSEDTLYVLLGAVGLVLLIACANVANLLLARATNRSREMVVRAAVGAGRGRLVRQLLTESALLGLAAGLSGAWLARLGVRGLLTAAPPVLPRLSEVQVDVTALAFALGIGLVASFLFGLAPALHISRVQLVDGLRQGGKGSSVGARGGWARSAFVVAEVALAVVLVVGAGLLGKSLAALTSVDMGFDPDRLVVLSTNVPLPSLKDAPRATAFYRDLLADLRTMPGLEQVSAARSIPTQLSSSGAYFVEGVPRPETLSTAPTAVFNVTAPGYFETVRVPVRRGRDFSENDRMGAPFVAIINEALARAAFGDTDPLGRRIQCGLDTLEFMTIVGVVADVRTRGPATPAEPEIYMPYEQHPMPSTALTIVARTQADDPMTVVEGIRRRIASMNPDVPVRATTMEGTLETATAGARFNTTLLIVFATVALLLAIAGVYGVMAYTVNQRVPELGVRIALGASSESIMRLVLGQGAKLALAGLAIGVGLALVSGRFLENMLFGVTARDPLILVGVTAVIAVATLAACYIPGRRAVRVDPMIALRAE
jgi:putative ABC transport system permease protein